MQRDNIIILSQREVSKVENISLGGTRRKDVDSKADSFEPKNIRSVTGSLLWFGTQKVPHSLYLASTMARKADSLKVNI